MISLWREFQPISLMGLARDKGFFVHAFFGYIEAAMAFATLYGIFYVIGTGLKHGLAL